MAHTAQRSTSHQGHICPPKNQNRNPVKSVSLTQLLLWLISPGHGVFAVTSVTIARQASQSLRCPYPYHMRDIYTYPGSHKLLGLALWHAPTTGHKWNHTQAEPTATTAVAVVVWSECAQHTATPITPCTCTPNRTSTPTHQHTPPINHTVPPNSTDSNTNRNDVFDSNQHAQSTVNLTVANAAFDKCRSNYFNVHTTAAQKSNRL